MAQAYRLELEDGRAVFAKTHPSPPAGLLHDRGERAAVARGARGRGVARGAGRVRRRLPRSPRSSCSAGSIRARRGRPPRPTSDGSSPRSTRPHRRRSVARTAGRPAAAACRTSRATPGPTSTRRSGWRRSPVWLATAARCPPRAIAALERLDADRLREVGGPAEPPARLHGDLWAGNRLVDDDGRSWLIDPAAHGGHREFDLAMMRLFGGFGADCFAAYEEVHPLADGWQERVPLHQIAPLVVHAIKFGGGYVTLGRRARSPATPDPRRAGRVSRRRRRPGRGRCPCRRPPAERR